MKPAIKSLGVVLLGFGLILSGCAENQSTSWESIKNPEVVAQLKSFVAEKEAQADAAAKANGKSITPQFKPFFSAAEKGDWLTMNNLFPNLQVRTGQAQSQGKNDLMDLKGTQWEAVKEIWGAFDEINEGDEKYTVAFGNGIIEAIPPGSIYFGGTDSGRFIVTALQKSHVEGNPFFTLTQNALADGSYLEYLRSMYGGKIYTPTADDAQKCFQDYTEDVSRRQKNHQLRPGEDVTVTDGRVQVSGQVAVMEINGLLTKVVFDKNPDREFYVEESFPLDWMYPYLEPHGLIMKINRQPLASLSDEIVKRDHDYWSKQLAPMIGGWLDTDTPVQKIAEFAEKVFARNDLTGFHGDPEFVQNGYSCIMFSKLRSSQGGLYAWRVSPYCPPEYRPKSKEEVQLLVKEADFAFRQAWALCPYTLEAVYRYVNFLVSQNRVGDALLVAETALKIPKMKDFYADQLRILIEQLKRYQTTK
jgi:hypothetical protein